MGRPSKEGVDYFPHKAKHGETMFILEKNFGNDGYAAWFKILEALASKEGHFLDCNNGKPTWEYLKAKTNLDDNKLKSVVDLLAKIDAIDSELWDIQVIWCQHLVDGIADVYRKRKTEIPIKPSFRDRKYSRTVISATESTQRERESKVKGINKISVTEIPGNQESKFELPDWLSIEDWKLFLSHRKNKKAPVSKDQYPFFVGKFRKWKEQGHEPHFVVTTLIERGWQSFKPEWLESKYGDKGTGSAVSRGLAKFLSEETEPGGNNESQ